MMMMMMMMMMTTMMMMLMMRTTTTTRTSARSSFASLSLSLSLSFHFESLSFLLVLFVHRAHSLFSLSLSSNSTTSCAKHTWNSSNNRSLSKAHLWTTRTTSTCTISFCKGQRLTRESGLFLLRLRLRGNTSSGGNSKESFAPSITREKGAIFGNVIARSSFATTTTSCWSLTRTTRHHVEKVLLLNQRQHRRQNRPSAPFNANTMSAATTNRVKPLVIVGPSGVGKGTLIEKLNKNHPNSFGFSVSHTTRDPGR